MLALSLYLTVAMVTLLDGAASPSFFWVVLFVVPLHLRVLRPPLLGGAVSLIGLWVVLGTNQFGTSKTSGSPNPQSLGSSFPPNFRVPLLPLEWCCFSPPSCWVVLLVSSSSFNGSVAALLSPYCLVALSSSSSSFARCCPLPLQLRDCLVEAPGFLGLVLHILIFLCLSRRHSPLSR